MISIEKAFYLLKHFENISSTDFNFFKSLGKNEMEIKSQLLVRGSKFYSEFCDSPFKLEKILNNKFPQSIIHQKNNRSAYIFDFENPIGFDSIIHYNELSEMQKKNIKTEIRSEFKISIVLRESGNSTNTIVLIKDDITDNWITCFPGKFAPAFPNSNMEEKEKKYCKEFWESHFFLE
jgi:hypothetical protein